MRGWSQADLAEKAGVAERTVRNAESGAPVKHHVADYVAGALEIGVKDLALDRSELPQRLQWQEIASVFQTSLDGAVISADFAPMLALAHPQIVLRCEATSLFPFCGEFHGFEGMTMYAKRVKRWFDERRILDRKFVFERIEGDGDLLFVRGKHTLTWELGATDEYWFAHFFRIEDDRIARFEQFIGM